MAFDFDGARAANVSDEDIVLHLRESEPDLYDFEGATSAGVASKDIVDYLSSSPQIQQKVPPPIEEKPSDILGFSATPSESVIQEPEGLVQPEDTMTTLTMPEVEERQRLEESRENLELGAAATVAGGYQGVLDVASKVPALEPYVRDKSVLNQEVIRLLNEEIGGIAERTGTTDDFFSPQNVGRFLPALATLPVTYGSMGAAFVIEGALGYAESRGSGDTEKEALIDGLLIGGLTAGTMGAIDYLTTPASKLAHDVLIKRFNYTDTEAEKIYQKWTNVMEPSGNEHADRVKSLLDDADKNRFSTGTKFKARSASGDIDTATAIEKEILDRKDSIKQLASTKYEKFEDAATDIRRINTQIKEDYSSVKNSIIDKNAPGAKIDISKLPEGEAFESLPDFVRSDLMELKLLSRNENITVHDLLDAEKAVNNLLTKSSVKGTSKGYNLGQIKGQIHKALKNSIPREDFKKWLAVNGDYRKMKQVQNSKLGKGLEQLIGVNAKTDSKTITSFLKELPNVAESRETFKSIEYLIGSQKAGKLESKIVDSLLDNPNPYDWAKLQQMVGNKGFVSDSGQNLQQLSRYLSDSFKTDKAYQSALQDIEIHQGAKTTIQSMLEALMVKQFAEMAVRLVPVGKTGKAARLEKRISDILSNPNSVKKVEEAIDNVGMGVRQRIIADTVKQIDLKQPPLEGEVITSKLIPGGKQ